MKLNNIILTGLGLLFVVQACQKKETDYLISSVDEVSSSNINNISASAWNLVETWQSEQTGSTIIQSSILNDSSYAAISAVLLRVFK